MDDILQFLSNGVLNPPWWVVVVYTLVTTHITIASVTIFLHRHQTHRAIDLHPIASHFFRGWLSLGTGMITIEWVAIHRKHHAKCETDEDPHSPQIYGIKKVFWQGVELYRKEAKNADTLEKYGHGTPDDWIERNVYTKYPKVGIGIMLIIDLVLFGAIGATVWAVQMLWIPVLAAGGINGLGHYEWLPWSYRNFDRREGEHPDHSTNIAPCGKGILVGGEEHHNNHHTYPLSAKFSVMPWEFDIGWMWICILEKLKLATVKHMHDYVHDKAVA